MRIGKSRYWEAFEGCGFTLSQAAEMHRWGGFMAAFMLLMRTAKKLFI
jgi:hypothetical protein